jgi:hypothetical protein
MFDLNNGVTRLFGIFIRYNMNYTGCFILNVQEKMLEIEPGTLWLEVRNADLLQKV